MEVMLSEAFVTGWMPQPVFHFLLWCPYQLLLRMLITSFSVFLSSDGYAGEEITIHTPMTLLSKFPKYLVPTGKILIKIFSTWGMELWMDHRRTCSLRASCQNNPLQDISHWTLKSQSGFIQTHCSENNLCPEQPCSLDFILLQGSPQGLTAGGHFLHSDIAVIR